MQFEPKQPTAKGPAELFTGDVHFDVIARGDAPSRLRVNLVRFSPGARTAWHRHSLGQTLHVMCRLAMWEDDATWGDHVTDDEYGAAPIDLRG